MTGRARIKEIASLANVGSATVDRVIHGRSHVSDATRQKVLQAKSAIESGAWTVRSPRPWHLKVILPEMAGLSTEYLAQCFNEFGALGNAIVECAFSPKLEPAALARKLRNCGSGKWDVVIFQALEDPRVRDAVSYLNNRGVPCLSLLSPLPNAPVIGFVGSDGRAAGRTAGLLMGLACPHGGEVVVISGGQLYRSHENREMGFRSYLRSHAKHLKILETVLGYDTAEQNHENLSRIIRDTPGLVGLYNVGGGNEGIVRALCEANLTSEICVIAHNLTPRTRSHLGEGIFQFILHQDMRLMAERAIHVCLNYLINRQSDNIHVPVEIITRENLEPRDSGQQTLNSLPP